MEDKKEKRKSGIALTLLFAGVTFAILMLFILLITAAIVTLTKNDLLTLEIPGKLNNALLIVLFILFCLLTGAGISFLLSKILTNPINRILNAMNRIAQGDYKARFDADTILGKYHTVSEITEAFNKMSEQLEKTEILHTDFVNNFSHEFKTPIVSISGFAKLLKRSDLSEEEREEYTDVIVEESDRLLNMATGMLQLSKIERQTYLTDKSRYNLSEQLRSCVLLLENQWTEKQLEPELPFDEIEIEADEDLLKQVWLNLIGNAVKYSDPGTVFTVAAEKGENFVAVSVADFGADIPEKSLPYVFNKFYQADESHSGEGSGIGLAVAQKIVYLHGGKIDVESANGKTVFTVNLPQTK